MRARALFVGAAAVVLTVPSAAPGQRGLSIGPKVGLSMSRIRGADAEEVDSRSHFTAGVVTSLALGERLAVEVHGGYVQKGGTMTGTSSFNGTIRYRFDYIEVPVLLRYRLLRGRQLSSGMVLGVVPAFLRTGRTSGSLSGLAWPRQWVLPKGTDFGLVLGMTVGMPAGRHQIRFDASYTFGLPRFAGTGYTGSFPSLTPVQSPDVDLKNSAFVFTVGYTVNVAPRLLARGS